MRIRCPYCGERDLREFTCLGEAVLQRPDPDAPDALERFAAYVYLRDNPAGTHAEFWHHAAACHAWLLVTRNTFTHEIVSVAVAKDARREGAAP